MQQPRHVAVAATACLRIRRPPRAVRRLYTALFELLQVRPFPSLPIERLQVQLWSFLRFLPTLTYLGLIVAAWIVDTSPLWRLRGWRRLHSQPLRRRQQLLTELNQSASHTIQLLALSINGLAAATYFDQPEVIAHIGYAPRPYIASRVRLRKRLSQQDRAALVQGGSLCHDESDESTGLCA